MLTVPASPETPRDFDRVTRRGVRTISGAAEFLDCSRRRVQQMCASGELWSYIGATGKRMIPLLELQRVVAAEAMGSHLSTQEEQS